MLGKTVLYLPGFDHAGIATQSVVEKRLAKDKNLTRHDLGRPAFVDLVWEWKEKYSHRFLCLTIDTMQLSKIN
jgi:valyl-tRNA synthetase